MTNLYFKIRFKSSASSIGAFIDPLIDRLQTSTRDGKSGRKKKKRKRKKRQTLQTRLCYFSQLVKSALLTLLSAPELVAKFFGANILGPFLYLCYFSISEINIILFLCV